MGKLARIVGISAAVTLTIAVLACGGLIFTFALAWKPDRVTAVEEYPRVLEEWSPSGLVDHFPATIPTQARNVRFSALSMALSQGQDWIQLRMQLPPAEVLAIEAQTKARAVKSCPPQCSLTFDENFWAVPMFTTGAKEEHRFPTDFTVYALNTDGDWNHPTGSGVAISTERNEVVYWAEW